MYGRGEAHLMTTTNPDFGNTSTCQVEDAELQRFLVGAQLRSVGDNLKAAVKMEVGDQEEDAGLGWNEDHGLAGVVEDENDEYDEEVEEEEEQAEEEQTVDDQDADSWTRKDWEHVKQTASGQEVVDVDAWAKSQPWGQQQWKIKAPWARKPAKQPPSVRKHDKWGGTSWTDGWYQDKQGNWWPQLGI